MKVIKAFKVVMPGDVYPTSFEVGDDIEGHAAEVGREMGCVAGRNRPANKVQKAQKGAPENKSR